MPTPSTAPSGLWAGPIGTLQDMLAACPSWLAWTGAANAAQARARTYPVDLPPPDAGADRAYTADELVALRPNAVVDTVDIGGGGLRLTKYAESDYTQAGELLLTLEDNVSPNDTLDPAAAKLKFMALIGDLLADLTGVAGAGGFLNITNVAVLELARSSVEEVASYGDRFICWVRIGYGV